MIKSFQIGLYHLHGYIVLKKLIPLLFLSSATSHAQIIQIDFAGLAQGVDELGEFGLSADGFFNEEVIGSITVDFDKIPLPSEENSDYVYYKSDNSINWIQISFMINGVSLNDVSDEYSSSGSFDILNPDDGGMTHEGIGFMESFEITFDPLDLDTYSSFSIVKIFRLKAFDNTDFLTSTEMPDSLAGYEGFNIYYSNGSFTSPKPVTPESGTTIASNFYFTELSSLSMKTITVPEPSSALLFVIPIALFRLRKKR